MQTQKFGRPKKNDKVQTFLGGVGTWRVCVSAVNPESETLEGLPKIKSQKFWMVVVPGRGGG